MCIVQMHTKSEAPISYIVFFPLCNTMFLFLLVLVVFHLLSLLHGENHFLSQHMLCIVVTKDRVHEDPMLVLSKQLRCILTPQPNF